MTSRVYRGARDSTQKVLDVGAGTDIDSRATHAVDKLYADSTTEGYHPFNIDVDKQKLPYTDDMFDMVVSYGAWGWNFGNKKSAKEIYRVLKYNDKLEIGISADNIQFAVDTLSKTGFLDIQVTELRPIVKITAVKRKYETSS